jgi:putative transposase
MISRPLYRINLLSTERRELEQLVRGHKTPQLIARRARIILMANEESMSNADIARALGINKAKVTLWTQRWIERGLEPVLDRLRDLPRPGAPDTITPEQWCRVMALACESSPSARIPDESLEQQGSGRRGGQARHRRAPFAGSLAKSAPKKRSSPTALDIGSTPSRTPARTSGSPTSAPCISKPRNDRTSWSGAPMR